MELPDGGSPRAGSGSSPGKAHAVSTSMPSPRSSVQLRSEGLTLSTLASGRRIVRNPHSHPNHRASFDTTLQNATNRPLSGQLGKQNHPVRAGHRTAPTLSEEAWDPLPAPTSP